MNEIHLIKNCPQCGKQLRFPIERGIIKVKCPCGCAFIVNPDNTDIYRDARFDLNNKQPQRKPSLKPLKERVIRGLWQYRYNLQNIRLLTGKTRRNTIIVTGLIILALLSLLCLAIILVTPPKKYII